MKKFLVAAIAVVSMATMSQAAPRFGAVGYTEGGVGAIITDSAFNAHLTLQRNDDEIGGASESTVFELGGAIKFSNLGTEKTVPLVGANLLLGSGEVGGTDTDFSGFQLVAGIEHEVNTNVRLLVDVTIFETITADPDAGAKMDDTGFFNGGRVGLVWLFN